MAPSLPISQTSTPRRSRDRRLWFAGAYLVAGAAAMGLPHGRQNLVLNLLITLLFLQAATHMVVRAREEPGAALGWRLLGAALATQACNQGWAFFALLRGGQAPPFPSWGEILSLLCLGLVMAGLLAWPLASASGSERLRKGLDGLGTAISAFFLSWFFALGPLLGDPLSPLLSRLTWVAFFLGNATILGLVTYLGVRGTGRLRGPLGWILAAFALSLLQVTLQVRLVLQGHYRLGHPLDLLVLLAGLALLLAPLSPKPVETGPAPGEESRDPSISALLLPILPASSALGVAFGALLFAPERLAAPVIGMGILLAALGLVRALLALRDLQRLSSALEGRVQERTQALEAAQDLLLRTERLNSMAILGAGLAHDLKNLLGVVRLRSDLLAHRIDCSEPGAHQDLAGIHEAVGKAESLVQDLLAVGRGQEDPPTEVDLSQRVRQLGALLRAALPASIRLRVEFPGTPALIESQPGRVDQMVVNLVLNARDAMPKGGTLLLRVALVEEGAPPQAELTVADTGVGIPEEVRDRIFEPFFTTKPPGRGTGLGLASVLQTVTDLQGTLSLTSQPGRGTTFTLRFPAHS